ncbi:HSP20-like chaperone [Pseudohyphozyma bogoriensis]|nr:HSP20-like chaperone [Pseudohyphozyma bogoriensis]
MSEAQSTSGSTNNIKAPEAFEDSPPTLEQVLNRTFKWFTLEQWNFFAPFLESQGFRPTTQLEEAQDAVWMRGYDDPEGEHADKVLLNKPIDYTWAGASQGLVYLHSNHIAHLNISYPVIFSGPLQYTRAYFKELQLHPEAPWPPFLPRWAFSDFGFAVRGRTFIDDVDAAPEREIQAAAPEMRPNWDTVPPLEPYNPYKADVWQLGRAFRMALKAWCGVPYDTPPAVSHLDTLIDKMVDEDPVMRPTAPAALQLFLEIKQTKFEDVPELRAKCAYLSSNYEPSVHSDNLEFGATSFLHPIHSHNIPQADVLEDATRFVIFLEMPGVAKESVILGIHGNHLIINGHVPLSTIPSSDITSFRSRQRRHGSFVRTFTINAGVQESELEAKLENGVLRVVVPKVGMGMSEKKGGVVVSEGSMKSTKSLIGR